MRRLPTHEVRIHRHRLYAGVTLLVEGRKVAYTSLEPNINERSEKIRDFIWAYFHYGQEKKRDNEKDLRGS